MIGMVASFLTGPLGKWVILAGLFLAWTVWQRDQAADKAREQCQAEQLKATIEELQRQRNAANEAVKRAAEQAAATREELLEIQGEYDEIRKSLSEAEATASCNIPPATLKRLRNIR